jgi:glutathione S-transferase
MAANEGYPMAEFIVHSIPGSPFGRSVLATLVEKGASWRLSPVRGGTFREPPHILRHPFGRVPVLDHSDFQLYETQAILRYLDRVLPSPALTPTDPRAAARMDQIMAVNDWYVFQGVSNVICFQRIISPRLMGGVPDEAAIEAVMPRAHVVFNELGRLLGEHAFMAGAALSLADLHLAPQLAFLAETPEWAVLTARNPNLVAWLVRMAERPSFASTSWEALTAAVQVG